MLHVFAFDKVGVAVGDLYVLDPRPGQGQEGAERGVRLEVRLIAAQPSEGSIYASRPILIDRPIWRADLLESVAGGPGTFDRTHHHPKMRGWEPDTRQFDDAMTDDPLGFVAAQLGDLAALAAGADVDPAAFTDRDAEELRAAVPEIIATTRALLAGVRSGELASPPGDVLESARVGWL
ncbi:MAG TPA: hypothetical protein VGU73_12850 [Acidimicrobiia bacterium]|nr:hypothetical protein [Acidimicrobiia bacterium]